MSTKPIFVATHPRACSTAFERVFMTQSDLKCIHEPFGDAFYYGPERLSLRFEDDEKGRAESGFSNSTYQTILDRFDRESAEGKRLFIKDITYYLLPPDGAPSSIAPTLARKERGVGTQRPHIDGASSEANGVRRPYPYKTESEPGNPTVIPEDVLKKFHFTFLIRHPKHSIPSFYRCTIPPLDEMTGFYNYMPSEAGYGELRRFFDHLRSTGQVGPSVASYENHDAHLISNGTTSRRSDDVEICVVDADDLLDNPAGIIQAYCKSVGMHYDKSMLSWSTEKDEKQAREAFEKWKGFHEDAIGSCDLKPRAYVGYNFNMHSRRTADRCFDQKKKLKTREEENAEWTEKFGEEGAKVIRETVDANLEDYEYLKQFALNV